MRKIFAMCVMSAFLFVACGDDSSSSGPDSKEESSSSKKGDSSKSSSSANSVYDAKNNTLKDFRDGQKYKTVTIGEQVWMAENLNYETEDSHCYNDKESNCDKYGRLYTWAEANEACPDGFHLPTDSEWNELYTNVGGKSEAALYLKSESGWAKDGGGTDKYSFRVLPAGYMFDDGTFSDEGKRAYFWTATEYTSTGAVSAFFLTQLDEANMFSISKDMEYSVRCVMGDPSAKSSSSKGGSGKSSSSKAKSSSSTKKSSSSAKSSSATSNNGKAIYDAENNTMKDPRDNKTYKTVKIGDQVWMAENLNYKSGLSYCFGEEPSSKQNSHPGLCNTYGRLYKWDVATEVCPDGWHLPSKTEFETLLKTVGGADSAGIKLKSVDGWKFEKKETVGTDDYGWTALPGGYRKEDNLSGLVVTGNIESYDFIGDKVLAYFWTSTEDIKTSTRLSDGGILLDHAFSLFMKNVYADAFLSGEYMDNAMSVRCIMDSAPTSSAKSSSSKKTESSSSVKSSSSQKTESSSSVKSSSSAKSGSSDGELVDERDGQTYKTVKIGNQVWMAENLNLETPNSYCYNDSAKYCTKYGRLYTWAAAMDGAGKWSTNGKGCGDGNNMCLPMSPVRGVCPERWHLPTKAEFETLITAVGGIQDADADDVWSDAGKMLKSISGWNDCGKGADHSGDGVDAYAFLALPAGGWYDRGKYDDEGNRAVFWSSTEYSSSRAYSMSLEYCVGYVDLPVYNVYYGFSVRCVKD